MIDQNSDNGGLGNSISQLNLLKPSKTSFLKYNLRRKSKTTDVFVL